MASVAYLWVVPIVREGKTLISIIELVDTIESIVNLDAVEKSI